MDTALFIFVIASLLNLVQNSVRKSLNDYILHHEEIHYDVEGLNHHHTRRKRSTESIPLILHFNAFNRNFHLLLQEHSGIFALDHKLRYSNKTEENIDTSHIYRGVEKNTPGSDVQGAIINGIFQGQIDIPGDTTYHIEAADKYRIKSSPCIMYREKDMNLNPYRKKRDLSEQSGGCGLEHFRGWMDSVSQSAASSPTVRAARSTYSSESGNILNKYSATANEAHHREKRRVINLGQKNTCYMYLRSDPLLYNYIQGNAANNVKKPDKQVRDEILAFFASHVSAINKIYGATKFVKMNTENGYQGIQFLVQRTSIMTDTTEKCGTSQASDYCTPNIDVSNFLNLNSKEDHGEFCLAYVFTYRDFTQGTLGLAWVGSSTRASGGICEVYKDYTEGNKIQVKKSLNTGIVTTVNFRRPVPAKVSQLTFAHEVGHNFGSPHDSGSICAPFGTSQPDASEGNYIMFPSATHGDKPHNSVFSECSKDNITRVLEVIINEEMGKKNCFKQSDQAFCGNGLVEKGEECDCGYASDCTDSCCNPKGSGSNECRLKPGAQCSPTAGPCCSETCRFIEKSSKLECRYKSDCTDSSYCGGNTAKCPEATKQKDGEFCNAKTQTCKDGQCLSSVCARINWEECFLTSTNDGDKDKLCYVSCQKPNVTGCISSYETEEVQKHGEFVDLLQEISNSTKGVNLPAGSPCNNYRGYCGIFNRCIGVDAEGPLARLKNLIFSEETLQDIKDWIIEYWWAVMLMCLGLVLFMAAFIKVCAVHTPSHNPNLKPARKLSFPRQNRQRPPQPQQEMERLGQDITIFKGNYCSKCEMEDCYRPRGCGSDKRRFAYNSLFNQHYRPTKSIKQGRRRRMSEQVLSKNDFHHKPRQRRHSTVSYDSMNDRQNIDLARYDRLRNKEHRCMCHRGNSGYNVSDNMTQFDIIDPCDARERQRSISYKPGWITRLLSSTKCSGISNHPISPDIVHRGPPPPYSASGAPYGHGRGPRYDDHGKGGHRGRDMESNRI